MANTTSQICGELTVNTTTGTLNTASLNKTGALATGETFTFVDTACTGTCAYTFDVGDRNIGAVALESCPGKAS